MLTFVNKPGFNQDAAVVLVTQEQVASGKFAFNYAHLAEEIAFLKKQDQFSGAKGEVFPLRSSKQLVLLVGLGETKKVTLTSVRVLTRKGIQIPFLRKAKTVELVPHDNTVEPAKAVLEGALIGGYTWRKYMSVKKDSKVVFDKKFVLAVKANKTLESAVKICEGVNFTRDLVNDNADVVTGAYIEKTVASLIKGHKNVKAEILGRAEMRKNKLGFHLAVAQGSAQEPKLIIVKYTGNANVKASTAIVGKGVTFDTGGLNLKTSGHIEAMRFDMGGSAAVVGTLKNVLALKPKKNIIFVMAMAENAIDALAYKPGDVITGYAGKSVEVGNTDAEGRLVLADAMSYVQDVYKPTRIVDIATLTGACIVALAYDHTALVSTDDRLASSLIGAAEKTDDRAWRLPIYPELEGTMKSKIADLSNISNTRGAGGTITAAEFLRNFVNDDVAWAHLDIAGTGWVDGAERWYYGHGATGAGVRLLTQFLLN